MKREPKEVECKDKDCGNRFTQFNSLQRYCSARCQNKNSRPNLKLKSFSAIPRESKKRKVERLQYIALRIQFLSKPENKICPITGEPTTEVHHKWSGKDRAKYYLDMDTWLAVSRKGHKWIHSNPKEAREKGFLY